MLGGGKMADDYFKRLAEFRGAVDAELMRRMEDIRKRKPGGCTEGYYLHLLKESIARDLGLTEPLR
jgi:hypothetical protein